MEPIRLRGARQHNLKGIDLDVTPGELLVLTGPSGAGKSSLALDTLYAEGQRRYVESFSPYARQFLDRLRRPDLDELEMVPPAIAVDRSAPARTGRSTVATRTEIAGYVKLLYAQAAEIACARCGRTVVRDRPDTVAGRLTRSYSGSRAVVWFPRACSDDAEHLIALRETLLPAGFARVLDPQGNLRDLEEIRPSDLRRILDGDGLRVVADRLVIDRGSRSRLAEALELALEQGRGTAGVDVPGLGTVERPSRHLRCGHCGLEAYEPSPGLFSFNNPLGACPACSGFGRIVELDPHKIVDDPHRSLDGEAIRPFRGRRRRWERAELAKLCRRAGIPTDVPWKDLSDEQRRLIFDGEGPGGDWWGIRAWFEYLETRSYKMHIRILLARYRRYVPCPDCGGARFAPASLGHTLGGLSIARFYGLTCAAAREHLGSLKDHLDRPGRILAREVLSRLEFLCHVGLGYLTLDRMSRTLSGGEAQRVGLATALGSSPSGTLFVIDEPTVGLHPADAPPLVEAVRRLASAGNPTLVIDNHEAFVAAADRVVDLGPGAGASGGEIVFNGPPGELFRSASGHTARVLGSPRPIERHPRTPRRWGRIAGAAAHNLRDIDVEVPLSLLTAVTGPSGSGKSTLVEHVLIRGLQRRRGEPTEEPGQHRSIEGLDDIDELILMDQSPLGRTSRGNAATYVKAWDVLRKGLADQPLARDLGFTPSTFSFNRPNGRCAACEGEGVERVEMQFLPDLLLPCPVCGGQRFQERVLQVRLRGLNAADLLGSTADQLLETFGQDRALRKRLKPLAEVGLGYLPLGQPLNTLSDGEAQRLKLARALATARPGSLLVLDEPSTGLHPADVEQLMNALHTIVDQGSTVVVVEHDLRVAAAADWVIDLGPGAGDQGGEVVIAGPPRAVAAHASSRTAPYLADILAGVPLALGHQRPKPPLTVNPVPPLPASGRAADEPTQRISVQGAREHNLRDVEVHIPRGEVCVVTGPSGSGKSTLTFDVIHAEGQRRYLGSLSPYVRQFLGQLPRPDVDKVEGVPPSIALEPRRAGAKGATVATLTEVGHFLRLLYARVGTQHCPRCQIPVAQRTRSEIAGTLSELLDRGRPISLYARVIHNRKGTHKDVFARAERRGIERVRVDGEVCPSSPPPKLARFDEHDIDLEVARLAPGDDPSEPVERALTLGGGAIWVVRGDDERVLSTSRSCPSCGRGFPELDPTIFSFHSRHGACPACGGKGHELTIDESIAFVPGLPLNRGGLGLFEIRAARRSAIARLKRIRSLPLDRPIEALTPAQRKILLEGRGRWPGLIRALRDLADQGVAEAEEMLTHGPCSACGGTRLSEGPRNVRLGPTTGSLAFPELISKSISQARAWLEELELAGRAGLVGEGARSEAARRLGFLEQTGVGYLTLDRPADTLSGGETQRVRLAAGLGAGLTGVCYVLDEPTIGLHPRDTGRLLAILRRLAEGGSTVLVVEHDEQTIRGADHLIDLGPGGGRGGGTVVDQGTPSEVEARAISPTGRALASGGRRAEPIRRPIDDEVRWVRLEGVSARNLKDLDVAFPLQRLTLVTGVSGSGKSTLTREVLHRAVRRALGLKSRQPGPHRSISGFEPLKRAIEVDQSPIGRTPRSVPATYLGIWGEIRRLLAKTPEARSRGFGPDRFSFNRKTGRCEVCQGQGAIKVEMSFLPDVMAHCEACGGTRFDRPTREVTYRGLSVDRILALTVEEALTVFKAIPKVVEPLRLMQELGLDYLTLGQPSNTLSGGEAQRLKLAAELGSRASGGTLYLLDEPTTGLHLNDVERLIAVLRQFVDRGDTVVVIEHHPELIWSADHVVDLGPEGGDAGGQIVVAGPPEAVRSCPNSLTGENLKVHRLESAGLPSQ